ncbi:endonuclease MutS2 [soil metagenome]
MAECSLFPDDAEVRLGFDRIREAAAEFCRGPLGRAAVRAIRPSADIDDVREHLALAGEMLDLVRFDDPLPVGEAPDLTDTLNRAAPSNARLDPEGLLEVLVVARQIRLAAAYVRARQSSYPRLAQIARSLEARQTLEAHLERVLDPQGRVRDDASSELSRLTAAIAERQASLRSALLRALRQAISEGYATEEQPTIRGGRAVIPVRAEAKRKVPGFIHDVSATGQTVYIEPVSVLDLNNDVRELEVARSQEIDRILREATGHVRSALPALQTGLPILGRIDALHAVARLGERLGSVVPQINDERGIDLRNARNPALQLHLLESANEGGAARGVVPLTAAIGTPERTVVITGPNAGGKSVAMKTVGLLQLMAQSGMPVPADDGTSLTVFDRIMVDLGDQQSIQDDLSTFTSHVGNLRRMVEAASPTMLALIDEAGTGTDPADGGALAQAVLETLTARGAVTIATTHHGTLKAFAHETPGVMNGSMSFDEESLTPTFQFRQHIPGSSYAFDVAGRAGLPAEILDRARVLVGEGKVRLENLLADASARASEAASAGERAAVAQDEAERLKAELSKRLETLREESAQLKATARLEAEALIHRANREIERTIREIKEAGAERAATRQARARLETFRDETAASVPTVPKRPRKTGSSKPGKKVGETQPVAVGDQVRLDNGAVGEVLDISGDEVQVALGNMKTRVPATRVQRVAGKAEQRVSVRLPREQSGDLPITHVRTRIDIRGQRAGDAVGEVMPFLDAAMSAGVSRVEILHGTGTGALRAAVREYIGTRSDVAQVEDAPWEQGGPGVSVVHLS